MQPQPTLRIAQHATNLKVTRAILCFAGYLESLCCTKRAHAGNGEDVRPVLVDLDSPGSFAVPTLPRRDRLCAKRPLGTQLLKSLPAGGVSGRSDWHDS